MSERWPPPTDPNTFESLCADLWGSICGRAVHKNGRNGQQQAGVDVYGKHGDKWIGIQCKQRDELLRSKLTPAELAREVAAARHFEPRLSRFIVATTGASDATIQEVARQLTHEHSLEGLFDVEVWSWTEIWAELNRRPALLRTVGPVYWPRLFFVADEARIREEANQIVRAVQTPLLPCGVFLTLRFEATDEDLERVYGGQAGFRELPPPLSPQDGRHFWRDRYFDIRNSVIESAGFFRNEHPGYNVLHRDVKHTVARFDPEKCNKPLSGNEPLFLPPLVTLKLYCDGRPTSADTVPTIILKTDLRSDCLRDSCALDNSVLVDYGFKRLSVAPPDATGLSVTSLRGSFIHLSVDFFYVKPYWCLPEESWPRLHNFQIWLGSNRHLMTFTLEDLSEQIIRVNPNPIARGDAVMPQIIFEREIDAEKFEAGLLTVQ
jgi:hypothetical protein